MSVLSGIGDFSRMTLLNVKTLRYYHDIGLLPAADVDGVSGYRRYRVEQAADAQVIRRLRDLGMPLEGISSVLTAPDVETRNAAIVAHLRHMEDQLQQTSTAVASLRGILEATSAPIPITFDVAPAMMVLAISAVVDEADGMSWRLAASTELRETVRGLASRGIHRAGPDAALYSSDLLENERGEVTVFLPVTGVDPEAGAEAGIGAGRSQLVTLPAAEYAVAEHVGGFEDLDQVFAALGTAVAQRAIGVPGPIREDYPVGELDTDDQTRWRTQIRWPVFLTTVDHATTVSPSEATEVGAREGS